MQNFDVVPLTGIGPVHLGMNRQQVQAAMITPAFLYQRTGEASPVDAFLENAFQVSYSQEQVEYIELSRGGPFVALYKGVSVFDTPAEEMVALIERDTPVDTEDPEFGYSFIFPGLELSLWRESHPEEQTSGLEESAEPGKYFDTVGVGRLGYYSNGAV